MTSAPERAYTVEDCDRALRQLVVTRREARARPSGGSWTEEVAGCEIDVWLDRRADLMAREQLEAAA